MSYRTYINGVQIFGNNETYPEWIDFISSQNIEIDERSIYKGTITDFMGALVVMEKITLRLSKQRSDMIEKNGTLNGRFRELFDWSNIPLKLEEEDKEDKYRESLFDKLVNLVNDSYAFLPYSFYLACEDMLEKDKTFSTDGHFRCYKLKEGKTIEVEAR